MHLVTYSMKQRTGFDQSNRDCLNVCIATDSQAFFPGQSIFHVFVPVSCHSRLHFLSLVFQCSLGRRMNLVCSSTAQEIVCIGPDIQQHLRTPDRYASVGCGCFLCQSKFVTDYEAMDPADRPSIPPLTPNSTLLRPWSLMPDWHIPRNSNYACSFSPLLSHRRVLYFDLRAQETLWRLQAV